MRRTLMMCMIVALAALPLLAAAQPATQTPEGRSTGGYLIPKDAQPRESTFEAMPDRDMVREAQIALRDAGYDPGRIDGVMGSKTQAALRKFQVSQGLPQTGRLDTNTRQELLAADTPASSRRR